MKLPKSLQSVWVFAALGLGVAACPAEDMKLKTPPPVPDHPGGRIETPVAGRNIDSGVSESGSGSLATGASGESAAGAGTAGGSAGAGGSEGGSSGAAVSGSGGEGGAFAAGSGGAGGAGGRGPTAGRTAGAGGASGAGGTSGASGDSANTLPPECRDQFCLDVTACWFFIGPDCGYTSCTNFTCM